MRQIKQLAAAAAVAVLVVPSAFAESRHSHETRSHDSGSHSSQHSDHSSSHESHQNWNRGSSETHTFDRGRSDNRSFNDRGTFDRGRVDSHNFNNDRSFNDRNFERGRTESFRNNDRFRDDSRRFDSRRDFRGSADRGRAFFQEGRVSRYERYGGGYRVWLVGSSYPFFIPEARFRLFPHFGVGLSIRLGGYWNPLGYYDYYDGPYDNAYVGSYYDGYGSPAYTSGDLTGVVESVDFRSGVALVRDRGSDRIIRVTMRGDDPRFGDLRIGDYVQLSGDWTRIGTFEAYRVYNDDPSNYRYR